MILLITLIILLSVYYLFYSKQTNTSNKLPKYDFNKIERYYNNNYNEKLRNITLIEKPLQSKKINNINYFFESNKKKNDNMLKDNFKITKDLRNHIRKKKLTSDKFMSRDLNYEPSLLEYTDFNEKSYI